MRLGLVSLVLGSSLALTLGAAACRGARRQPDTRALNDGVTDQTDGHAPLDGGRGTITVSSDAGAISATLGAGLPEDFPRPIPIYAGAKVVFAAKSTQAEGAPSWTATLESGDAKDRIVDFYKGSMTGFKLATSMDMGETSMCAWQGAQYDATLMATTQADGKTSFTVTATGK